MPLFVGLLSVACGGASETAAKNRTFYDWTTGGGASAAEFEKRYPPLDQAPVEPLPEYVGVTVVRDGVHLSRPRNWLIREANGDPGRSYIQYVSPKAYIFALYERTDAPTDLWRDVMGRYEDDLKSAGVKATGQRVPIASFLGQGRAYAVERKVEAAKKPLVSHSREILMRGEHRIVLVQVVHEGENLAGIDQELMRVLMTLEVL
jgi:hypothetical protein